MEEEEQFRQEQEDEDEDRRRCRAELGGRPMTLELMEMGSNIAVTVAVILLPQPMSMNSLNASIRSLRNLNRH